MSIIRTKKSAKTPYVMLDTTAVNDSRLSFRAKGLHTYLMSKPDGWQVHIEHLEKVSSEGKHAIRMALIELAQAGYLHREKVREESGRLAGWATTIYETPQHVGAGDVAMELSPSSPTSDFPTSDSPTSDSPTSENRTLVIIDCSKKALNENSPLTPINGGQNALEAEMRGTIADTGREHNVCSGGDRAPCTAAAFPSGLAHRPSRADGTNPRALEHQRADAAQQAVSAQTTACPYCDAKGLIWFLDAQQVRWEAKCPHDLPKILAYVTSHAYTWPGAPPAPDPPPTHGPAP